MDGCTLSPSTITPQHSPLSSSNEPPLHRYLGEQGEGSHIDGAVLVSPGFDMEVRWFASIVVGVGGERGMEE